MEDAARTEFQFGKVLEQWDHLDENRERKERNHKKIRSSTEMLHWVGGKDGKIRTDFDEIIPQPFGNAWWRQLLRGEFLDYIFDCPYEMHEQVASRPVSDVLKTLNENQTEVFYLWTIREHKPQQIARMRNQTDRNILKVYTTLINGLRKKLHEKLGPRFDQDLPLGSRERQFVENYRAGILKTSKKKIAATLRDDE